MATLSLKNLYLNYGTSEILKDISINVEDGEFLVLVGPSGSGKSTILRAIAGLEKPSSGDIKINNQSIKDLPPKSRDIAMVFQNYALYPHMTIFENLAFPLKMKKEDQEKINKSVDEVASLLGLKNYLKKRPKELSGGERQRVALGRAIIRKPKLFLMDEPLSNLDAKLRTQMRTEILKLQKTLNTTVIYVTHDQIEALTMGDRIAILKNGSIQQIDTPEKIYNEPSNTFVGGFIGSPSMNFFSIEIISNNQILFNNEKFECNINSDILKNGLNKKVILGIRPEKINLDLKSDIKFKSSIEIIEMLGNEYIIYFYLGDNITSPHSIKTYENISLKKGAIFSASFSFSNSYVFEGESGKYIGKLVKL